MPSHEIPARSSSRYAGQYSRVTDSQRLAQIFSESIALALNSMVADTARSRYELAIEAGYQFLEVAQIDSERNVVRANLESLVQLFPARQCMNEALGLVAKAAKLKTPRRKLGLLVQAREVLDRGQAAGCGGASEYQALRERVLGEIADARAQADARQ